MSWVYAEVGVLRPEIDPGELRTLAADWGLTSAGYYEASAELSSARISAFDELGESSAAVQTAHGAAADLVETAVLTMDATCRRTEGIYNAALRLGIRARPRLMALQNQLVADLQSTYAHLEAPGTDLLPIFGDTALSAEAERLGCS